MKTNKAIVRIQNSIKLAERTVRNMSGAPAEYIAVAEKNLATFRAMLAKEMAK